MQKKLKIIVNLITCSRFPLAAITAYAMWRQNFLSSAIIFGLAMASDWLDGALARRFNVHSDFAAHKLEPWADTALMFGGIIGLILAGVIPWPILPILIIFNFIVDGFIKPGISRPDRILFIQTIFLNTALFLTLLYLLYKTQYWLALIAPIVALIILCLKRKRIIHFKNWCFRRA